MTPVINAMTVDVEDYFQASAFDRFISRTSWFERESRVDGSGALAAPRRSLSIRPDDLTSTIFTSGRG